MSFVLILMLVHHSPVFFSFYHCYQARDAQLLQPDPDLYEYDGQVQPMLWTFPKPYFKFQWSHYICNDGMHQDQNSTDFLNNRSDQ